MVLAVGADSTVFFVNLINATFGLQNVTKERAFKPWKDPKCLAVMPGSC